MEQPAKYYDKKYLEKSAYHVHYSETKYYPMWYQIIRWLTIEKDYWPKSKPIKRCLDIGCGSGQLAHMAMDNEVVMDGFDFSKEGVAQANQRLAGKALFWIGDVKEKKNYYYPMGGAKFGLPYDVYVSTEVLEHVTDDFGMIKNIPKGAVFIFSVPTFGHEAHVRKFKAKKHVTNRYKHLIEFNRVVQFGKRFLSLGVIK